MLCAEETKFSLHKSFSPGVQLSLVYCSVYETCAGLLILHYSVAFCSVYVPGRKDTKNTLNTEIVLFGVCFAFLM